MTTPPKTTLLIGCTVLLGLLALSCYRPYDRPTWLLEVFPVLIALPILVLTHKKFPLTTLLYCLIAAHCVVLMVGGAYTYARVPFGFFLGDIFNLDRNPYDKIGHFFQGFVPAIVTRELLIRFNTVQRGKMLVFLILSVVLAISAVYELLEWASALALGQGADEFLGTQGDPWDTQSDMFCALIGATVALMVFSKAHDHQMPATKEVN